MTGLRRLLSLGIALALLPVIPAQEPGRGVEPEDIVVWTNGADSIVVGIFRAGWPLPWFDGWHYYSQIEVTEQLSPEGKMRTLPMPWVRSYWTSCFICADLRGLDGRSGIWFLVRRDGTLQVVGGITGFCPGPLDMRHLDAVRGAIRDKAHPRAK